MIEEENEEVVDEETDLINMIRLERQAKGEDINKLIIITDEELQAAKCKRYEQMTGKPYTEEDEKKLPLGNKIMLVSLLLTFILWVINALILNKDYLYGFVLSGLIISPAFASVWTDRSSFVRRLKKASWKFRLTMLIIGVFFLFSAICQAIAEEPALAFLKIFHAKD